MKSVAQANQPIPVFVPKAPDAIMAELWSTKQRINAEAGYDIDKLLARVKRVQGRTTARAPRRLHVLRVREPECRHEQLVYLTQLWSGRMHDCQAATVECDNVRSRSVQHRDAMFFHHRQQFGGEFAGAFLSGFPLMHGRWTDVQTSGKQVLTDFGFVAKSHHIG